MSKYPNLQKCEDILLANIYKLHSELLKTNIAPRIEAQMFPQLWSDTAGGFSKPGMIAGQAMTMQYTTVFHVFFYSSKENEPREFYGVFFDDVPAYLITEPTKAFLDDLKARQLKSKYEAEKCY